MDKFSELKAIAEKAKELGGINNYAKGKAAVLAFQDAANPSVVIALLAELEKKDKRIAELSVGKVGNALLERENHHVEVVDKLLARIAELETIRADASQVFKEIGNELGCNPDNESIMVAIDELKEREKRVVALANGNDELWDAMAHRLKTMEAKLATPVRLPEREFDDGCDKQVCILAGRFNSAIDKSAKAIRAAGFKCLGDE
ncbi:hypothetical protein [Serratia liquefaciens]|uniref:hypothetical protein n=1 Tax=Serratia liquefaciens TaxID=614 RepID=UPI0039B121EC